MAAAGTLPTQQPISCRKDHTAVTVDAGQLDAYADGHLLALDSHPADEATGRSCRRAFAAFIGGSPRTRQLTLLRPVWVLPSFESWLDGASWFRCDAVLLAGQGRLAALPGGAGSLRGVLDGAALPPRRYGRCSAGVPGARGSSERPCSRPHAWRAVAVVDVAPAGARGPAAPYPGRKAAAARASDRCERIATRAQGRTRFRYTAQIPTAADWRAGQRTGSCWLPD